MPPASADPYRSTSGRPSAANQSAVLPRIGAPADKHSRARARPSRARTGASANRSPRPRLWPATWALRNAQRCSRVVSARLSSIDEHSDAHTSGAAWITVGCNSARSSNIVSARSGKFRTVPASSAACAPTTRSSTWCSGVITKRSSASVKPSASAARAACAPAWRPLSTAPRAGPVIAEPKTINAGASGAVAAGAGRPAPAASSAANGIA